MGYRSNERLPLINKAPSNSGLYEALYSLAAKKIGCDLKIQRGPKKRILKKLLRGEIDFYPGFNFTQKRAKNIYYIENGIPGGDIGISRMDLETITNLKQLKGKILLSALGAADYIKDIEGIHLHKVSEMSVDRAIILILKNRGDFYIYNKSSLEYAIQKQKITDIKIHPNCCGGITSLYLGFSKKSTHFKSINNPLFDSKKQLSVDNYPVILDKSSIAYKFQLQLHALKDNGSTDSLYKQYYK
jgi:hypothetical protein